MVVIISRTCWTGEWVVLCAGRGALEKYFLAPSVIKPRLHSGTAHSRILIQADLSCPLPLVETELAELFNLLLYFSVNQITT